MEKSNWKDAKKAASKARAKSIYDFIQWRHLLTTGNRATFTEYKQFIERLKDYPRIDRVRYLGEHKINSKNHTKNEIIQWFDKHPPLSGFGKMMLGDALLSKNKESAINLQDVVKIAGKKSRLARLFIPSAASAVIAPFTIADAKARTAKAEKTGLWLDKVQAKLAQTEATADVTGVVPNPVSEIGGFGAGLSNILIDSGRWLAKDRSEEQSQNAEKAMQLQINR